MGRRQYKVCTHEYIFDVHQYTCFRLCRYEMWIGYEMKENLEKRKRKEKKKKKRKTRLKKGKWMPCIEIKRIIAREIFIKRRSSAIRFSSNGHLCLQMSVQSQYLNVPLFSVSGIHFHSFLFLYNTNILHHSHSFLFNILLFSIFYYLFIYSIYFYFLHIGEWLSFKKSSVTVIFFLGIFLFFFSLIAFSGGVCNFLSTFPSEMESITLAFISKYIFMYSLTKWLFVHLLININRKTINQNIYKFFKYVSVLLFLQFPII